MLWLSGKNKERKSCFYIHSWHEEISAWQIKLNLFYDWTLDILDEVWYCQGVECNFEFCIPAYLWFQTSNSPWKLTGTMQASSRRCLDYRNATRDTSTPTPPAIFNHYLSMESCWVSFSWETAFVAAFHFLSFPINGHDTQLLWLFFQLLQRFSLATFYPLDLLFPCDGLYRCFAHKEWGILSCAWKKGGKKSGKE